MDNDPKIVRVHRLRDDLILEFDNGTTALYSIALLREMLPRARDITDIDSDD